MSEDTNKAIEYNYRKAFRKMYGFIKNYNVDSYIEFEHFRNGYLAAVEDLQRIDDKNEAER